MTKVVLCPTCMHTHIHSTCPQRHMHATHACVHMHSHIHTQQRGRSVHGLLKLFQPCKFSQEPHSAVNSHFHGDSPFRIFQSDIVAVTALNNGRKDCASRNCKQKQAQTAACQGAATIFKPMVHTQTQGLLYADFLHLMVKEHPVKITRERDIFLCYSTSHSKASSWLNFSFVQNS